ncbi:hypothetical protein [Paenibacillus aquistagni]|uniref:Uncharacterized protein n=1 Tax=Paenibacillus aquistagni TaxID=1852522 RepID=A0A1X7J0E0_9BACL|nr:hypothetical protein [Paenibacillus aquistagni]NMM52836.1 hypothetical protein [Paenibacillus aquistagni]SMG20763.1 hypothetical protein SAMN06295960_1057 [Paenibacillus aquistagni]
MYEHEVHFIAKLQEYELEEMIRWDKKQLYLHRQAINHKLKLRQHHRRISQMLQKISSFF